MVQLARRGGALLVVAALAATAVACAGPGATTTDPSHAATRSATPPVGATGSLDCDDAALLRAPGEALTAFPDNPDVEWTARPSDATLGDLVLVGLTPDPDEVGYAEFRFVYRCEPSGPVRLASYALDGERFVLLATSDALGDEELPAELLWTAPETTD